MAATTLGTYVVICRRAYVPLNSDSDEVIIDNLGSIKLGLMALQYEDKSDAERAAMFWGPNRDPRTGQLNGRMPGAFDLLDTEREETEQAETPALSFGYDFAAGSIPPIH